MTPIRSMAKPRLATALCLLLPAVLVPAGSAMGAEAAPARQSWITNVSVLSGIDSPADSYTLGYVVGGGVATGDKQLLIRAAGPSLAPYGVTNAVGDPRLELYREAAKTGENDNWGGTDALARAAAEVGAFPFPSGTSLDAASLVRVSAGVNSVRIAAAPSETGAVLAEVYDTTPREQMSDTTPRLINVSVLKRIQKSLTVGFVIAGEQPKTVLVRAIGPTLATAPYNLAGNMPNPRFTLFADGARKVAQNDDWLGEAELADAFSATGAFGLPAQSKDAALIAQLEPGSYTVVVDDVGGASGFGLVEVYEIPRALAASPTGKPFTIAVLPDTQNYSKPGPPQNGELAMFTAQTDWIQAHAAEENIVYVAHVGDITNDGDTGGGVPAATQWANAVNAMSRLESPVSIPYGIAVGNHDEEPNGNPDGTTTRYNANFGISRFAGRPYYGGHYGSNNDNHYDLFTGAGRGYVCIYLKFDADNVHPEFTAWANDVAAAHPDRQVMLVMHSVANGGGDYSAFTAQGGRLYRALKSHSRFFLAFGGHVGGDPTFRRDPVGPYGGEKVMTFIANYQFDSRGGTGFMRLYRFAPDHGYMTARTYSPFTNQHKTDAKNEFTQSLDPRGPAEEAVLALSNDRLVVVAVATKTGAADTPERSSIAVTFQAEARTNSWEPWTTLAGQSGFRQVDAVALADDRVVVVGVGAGTDAWICRQAAPGPASGWTDWAKVPDTPVRPNGTKGLTYVKAVRLDDDRIAVAGWVDGGEVYVAQQDRAGGPIGPWASIGGTALRQGDLVRLSNNRLAVVAVGDSGSVQCTVQQSPGGGWSGWSSLAGGGGLFSYVCAVAKPDDTVAVFATRAEDRDQGVFASISGPGAVGWPPLAAIGTGVTGLARVDAVLRRDDRIALAGAPEHGAAYYTVQSATSQSFGAWQRLTPSSRHEIGSAKIAVLSDSSVAVFSHGAATLEYFSYQRQGDGEWVATGGLPVVWMR